MRPRALWASLLLACAAKPPPSSAPTTARPAIGPTTPARSLSGDEQCRDWGHDFAYPDFERDGVRNLRCGDGPGTDCHGGQTRCEGINLVRCLDGKLTALDCADACQQGPALTIIPHSYDSGTCSYLNGVMVCVCCDAGEPGCEHIKPSQPSPVVPLAPTTKR